MKGKLTGAEAEPLASAGPTMLRTPAWIVCHLRAKAGRC